MLTLYRNTSPSSTRAKLSRRFTRPSRIAFTSVPSSATPASKVSRMWKSWNAFRFSAIDCCAFSRSVFSAITGSWGSRLPRQPRRQQHRRDHALRIGFSRAGDVERSAVVDRRPDDRQAQRDVDRLAERDQLHRNEPLIVVAGHHDVELAPGGTNEHRVGRKRPGHVDAARSTGRNRRDDRALLFGAEHAVFAGMRVEAGNG